MIRDLSKKLNKEMELYMSGEETELDRTVIDEIGDPLMHLLRNAADHGLESNEERQRLGKNSVGSIFLEAYQEGNNVVIEVRDDGSGINVDKIKKKALERGTITEDQAARMSDKEIIDLLFQPSFSTAEQVTDVSGRGVGLDVVKTKIETLGGEIEARSVLGEGSTFIIRLPLTLAIIQALMVMIGREKFALPLGSIQTVENIPNTDVRMIQGKEVINLRGSVIPIIRLGEVLDCVKAENEPEEFVIVVVKKGERLAGLVVDELIGQQEIVIKSIGKYIKAHKIVSGSTILGNGEVSLILDVNSLI
jgi:two-component system chemotaxis sensor kinase CheA